MEIMVSHGDGFHITLGFIVYATWANRVYIPPVFFGLRVYQRIAIDLTGGSHQDPGAFIFGKTQAIVRTHGSYLQCLDRNLQVIDRAGRRCKMQDVINACPEYE
jgi:hypothetical protein